MTAYSAQEVTLEAAETTMTLVVTITNLQTLDP